MPHLLMYEVLMSQDVITLLIIMHFYHTEGCMDEHQTEQTHIFKFCCKLIQKPLILHTRAKSKDTSYIHAKPRTVSSYWQRNTKMDQFAFTLQAK